jgi:membrane protein
MPAGGNLVEESMSARWDRTKSATKSAGTAFWEAVKAWWDDGGMRLGASIAFYSMFALAPLLVIAIAVAGAVFGEAAARGEIVQQIGGLVGAQAARAIEALVQASAQKEQSIGASALGFATLLLAASGVFVELRNAFDKIWEPPPRGSQISLFVRTRLIAFALVIGVGFLVIVSLLLSAVLAGVAAYFAHLVPALQPLLSLVDIIASTLVLTFAFAGLIYALPATRPSARATWIGALFTAVLFSIGKYFIGLYLGRASIASAYGAAGSFVVVVLWVYYASQILLVGAELTAVIDRRRGGAQERRRIQRRASDRSPGCDIRHAASDI